MVAEDVLKACPVFTGLDDRWVKAIASLCKEQSYETGATIFTEGQEATALYILIEGVVGIRAVTRAGQDILVETIRDRAQLFGWSGLVEPRTYTALAKAMERTRALVIPADKLLALLDKDAVIGYTVMKRVASLISSRLRNSRRQLSSLLMQGSPITHG